MRRSGRRRDGLTRTELLIIIGGLAVVSVLLIDIWRDNSLGRRPKVSRVKNDQRSLATGIETYFVDHNAYPTTAPLLLHADDNQKRALEEAGGTNVMTLFAGNSAMAGMTTPVAYVTSLFKDPYALKGLPFAYYTDGPGWILYSPGPDGDYDVVPTQDYDSQTTPPSDRLLLKSYDPTNGAESGGDVWRVKQ